MMGLRSLAKKFTSPNGLRVVAFLAAILVWYAARAITSNSVIVKDIPVDILMAPNLTLPDGSTHHVDVTFLGSRDELLLLHKDAIRITLDLRAHTNAIPVPVSDKELRVNAPGSVRVEQIRPASFFIRLVPTPAKPVTLE